MRTVAILIMLSLCALARGDAQPGAGDPDGSPAPAPPATETNFHPFIEFRGVSNGSWFIFILIGACSFFCVCLQRLIGVMGLVALGASRIAPLFPSIGLPLITGYMF